MSMKLHIIAPVALALAVLAGAEEGVAFTDYYGQQSCTAGRAAFINGSVPVRTGMTKVGLPGAKEGWQKTDVTMATVLKSLGYATGQFGKNHQGDRDEHLPTLHGFDEFMGNLYHLNAEEEPENEDYPKDPEFRKKFGPRGVLKTRADGKGGQTIEDTGPLTKKRMETIDEETLAAAKEVITRQHQAGKPFFVWWNGTRMHFRTHVKAEHRGLSGQDEYGDGMVEHDMHVGELLKLLDELGIANNTLVHYSTDNGPHFNTWPDAANTPFRKRHPEVVSHVAPTDEGFIGYQGRRLLSILNKQKLERVLAYLLDENEFLGPYGIRSLSRYHLEHPFTFHVGGQEYTVQYLPGESNTGMFGGNSNWRGPVWMPVNALIIRALLNLYTFYGDDFKVQCPTGSERYLTLFEVAQEISRRLAGTFLRDTKGRRPVYGGTAKFQDDPHWRDLILFYEYFHGDNGAGLRASHQTGWTGLIARLLDLFGRLEAKDLALERDQTFARLVREQVGGEKTGRN